MWIQERKTGKVETRLEVKKIQGVYSFENSLYFFHIILRITPLLSQLGQIRGFFFKKQNIIICQSIRYIIYEQP